MKEYELEEEQSMSIQDAEVENTQLNSDTENQAQLEGNDQEPGEEKEEKAKREMFLRSPFLLVGLLIGGCLGVSCICCLQINRSNQYEQEIRKLKTELALKSSQNPNK